MMISVLSILMWALLALGGVAVLVAALMAAFDALPDPPQEPRSFTPSRRSEVPAPAAECRAAASKLRELA